MISPIYIFIVALGIGFLLSLFDKIHREFAIWMFKLTLAFMVYVSVSWLIAVINGANGIEVFTAGIKPPFSINLRFGLEETFFVSAVNIVGLFGAFYLIKKFRETPIYAAILYLIIILGINGMIMTRDLFNLFVFMEITSIATCSLIGINRDAKTLSAGFKYLIASGIASTLFLIGTIYLYRLTGTLNIDFMIKSKSLIMDAAGFVAIFLVLSAILIELKPFPANGWALDVYQAVDSGLVSIIAVANSAAFLFALYKIMPLLDSIYYPFIAGVGIFTFIFSNLIGIKQRNAKRLLGYSSIAQMGLIAASLALSYQFGQRNMFLIVGFLFINHFIAKAGLFWLAGVVDKENIEDWAVLSKKPYILLLFGLFIFALSGFPPFAGFWGKWHLLVKLADSQLFIWLWLILFGSLLEAVYLFRWFGYSVKGKWLEASDFRFDLVKALPIAFFAIAQFFPLFAFGFPRTLFLPILIPLALYFLDFLHYKIKGIVSIIFLAGFAYQILPELTGISFIFGALFLGGGLILLIGTLYRKDSRNGFYPLLIMLLLSLGMLASMESLVYFFFMWEIMTISSYLLILRGKRSIDAALKYILFSTGGAYLILAGFTYMADGNSLITFSQIPVIGTFALILTSLGFLIKTGAIGFHLWLPGSYSESEDDFSAIISAILSKAGVFGLMVLAVFALLRYVGKLNISYFIGWIGILTAFFGTLMAVFQEDIKKLLAYSSMGQVGYIVLTLGLMSHLGWISAIYLSINHFLFKGLLFLAIAGVIYRTKTREMYQMGGLIKRMPFSFISVLIGIIALSGVPPLSGFGGKWLLYNSLIEKGWFLQAGLAFFTSTIAFLYCYRLIHAIFLGQPKAKFKEIKKAPIFLLIPQYILIIGIMAISMFPSIILKPISGAISPIFDPTITLENGTVFSSLGYWNATAIMVITMVLFGLVLIWLIAMVRKPQKVKQFNIVFAAERPYKPETTHFAYNFFNPYRKALGFLTKPMVTGFWNGVAEWTASIAATLRNIYSGNGQTYALHIILYIVILYFIMK